MELEVTKTADGVGFRFEELDSGQLSVVEVFHPSLDLKQGVKVACRIGNVVFYAQMDKSRTPLSVDMVICGPLRIVSITAICLGERGNPMERPRGYPLAL